MLFNFFLEKKMPVVSSNLPLLTLIPLNKWILIKLTGLDSIQYLNNQLTCDVKNLKHHQYHFSAHCNVQGKMITNMYVLYLQDQKIAYIEPKNISVKQISTMKKYAIFSNVTITPDDQAIMIGITGLHAKQYLNTIFKELPNRINTVIHCQGATIIYFDSPVERFLLIVTNSLLLTTLLNKSKQFSAQYRNYDQWISLDIEAGYPYIDSATSELFFPQSVKMDILNGISFNKGCFLGQEMIARIQHLKLNKQSLYHLSSKLNQNQKISPLPKSGDSIALQINNDFWKKIGIVLQSCQTQENYIWIQAILNKSIIESNHACIKKIKINNNYNLDINLIK